ncbi:MAG: DUF563 domain-containing protein [Proteobacteria bacterium]|nr:DUF563 domain-containing protein [Pseudomonadota bacterium]
MRPIKAAAVAVEHIERSRLFFGPSEIKLSEPFQRRHGRFCGPVGMTTEALLYSLENVVLDADSMILLQDGLTIPETEYGLSVNQPNRPAVAAGRLTKLDDVGPYIVGASRGHAGTFSWLTQSLPAIDWSVQGTSGTLGRLVLPALQPWQEALLSALGYQDLPRFTPEAGCQYLIPRVRYATFLNGSTDFGVCLSKVRTARRILAKLRPSRSTPRRIYVPYDQSYYGRIINADGVADLLRRSGFHVLEDGDQSPLDRISMLRNADIVIGPHSDMLSYILFGKPGALLWEFMPPDVQNASINRLAQAAGIDYWGDVLSARPGRPGELTIDLPQLQRRLDEVDRRLTNVPTRLRKQRGHQSQFWRPPSTGAPLDELMLAFESLGDNCQFGLVQRWSGVEPLGLFRFSSIAISEEDRVAALVQALRKKFEGLGDPQTIGVDLNGDPPEQEYMILEGAYKLSYHTGATPADHSPDQLLQREVKRLPFLARKMLDDMSTGTKIWMWSCPASTYREHVQPLLDCLREMGPNKLLWVVLPNEQHAAGTFEQLDQDLIRGYAHRFMLDSATEDNLRSWHAVCQGAYDIWGGESHEFPSHADDWLSRDTRVREGAVIRDVVSSLQANFPLDRLDYQSKSDPNSDFIYTTVDSSGRDGVSIYCSIDTDGDGVWLDERLAAVRQNATDAGVDVAVFVSSAAPAQRPDLDPVSGVWVTTPQFLISAFTRLRLATPSTPTAAGPLAGCPERFYGLGDCQREITLAHQQGSDSSSAATDLHDHPVAEPWTLQETIRHLMTGFIGLADTPSLVCPFHQWVSECKRGAITLTPVQPLEGSTSEVPWWKRNVSGGASGTIDPCAMHEALKQASRIFVWRSVVPDEEADVRKLLTEIGRRGRNILLWVTSADDDHPAGLVEYVGSGLLRGYLASSAADGLGTADARSWRMICQNAANLADHLYRVGEFAASHGTADQAQPGKGVDGDDVEISEAAAETFLEEAASTDVMAGPVDTGGAFSEEDRASFAENPGSQDVHGALLENVVMLPHYPVLIQKGRKVADSVRSNTLPFERGNLISRAEGLRALATDKIAIVGFNRSVATYYHWIIQSLPAIYLPAQRFGPDRCALVVPRLAPWQEESLALLGLGQIMRVETSTDMELFFPRVYFSGFLTGRTSFSLSPCTMAVMDKMAETIEPATNSPRRLYVSRTDSANRRLINEPEVERVLSEHDFTVIVPGTLSLRQQIRLFRGAEMIVGPHGSGMANLAFCRPGTKVLELVQSNYANSCMNRIAQVRRLQYHAECFETASIGDIHAQPWSVDMSQLMRKIRDFIT